MASIALAQQHAEVEARDRESILHQFLETLLRNMREDLITAVEPVPSGSSADVAATDCFNQLMMAEEYLAELKRLGDRSIAGTTRSQ